MTTVTTVVAAAGVRKRYRRSAETVDALAGVSLEVGAGELVVVIGPSGAGKTTLVNVLCGWDTPDAGEVRRTGGDGWHDVAVVPQGLGLLEELSAEENVGLPLRLAGKNPDVARVLDGLGLGQLARRSITEISMGERQRTAVARALAVQPRLLLADEPTSHQDAGFARVVLTHVRAAADAGSACLVVTHDSDGAEAADRVLELRSGRLL
jgi:ABC-type lipoprotein export system ATPase subunit